MTDRITIKKVEYSERMSEETPCFVANLYVDNKKCGTVKNDGRGGNTFYEINQHNDLWNEVVTSEFNGNGEDAVDTTFEEWLLMHDAKKLVRQGAKVVIAIKQEWHTELIGFGDPDADLDKEADGQPYKVLIQKPNKK